MIKELFVFIKFDEDNKPRYIGYVILNYVAVMLMEAQCKEDIDAYCKDKGIEQWSWRIPVEQKFKMIRTKEW